MKTFICQACKDRVCVITTENGVGYPKLCPYTFPAPNCHIVKEGRHDEE